MRRLALALLLVSAAAVAANDAPPAVIQECETGTATYCGTWTWNGSTFDASWPIGTTAVLRVQHFDAQHILIERSDTNGPTAGLIPSLAASLTGFTSACV